MKTNIIDLYKVGELIKYDLAKFIDITSCEGGGWKVKSHYNLMNYKSESGWTNHVFEHCIESSNSIARRNDASILHKRNAYFGNLIFIRNYEKIAKEVADLFGLDYDTTLTEMYDNMI